MRHAGAALYRAESRGSEEEEDGREERGWRGERLYVRLHFDLDWHLMVFIRCTEYFTVCLVRCF